MTYLGIDYGTKRIGLAVAHDETRVATPIETVSNNDAVLDVLSEIIRSRGVGTVVLGVPINTDGSEGLFAGHVREFGDAIGERLGVTVHTVNEAFTTDTARAAGARDADAASAALILQSWLDDGESV